MKNTTFKSLAPAEMGAIKGGGVWVYVPETGEWVWVDIVN